MAGLFVSGRDADALTEKLRVSGKYSVIRSFPVPTSAEKKSITYCMLVLVPLLFALLYLMRSGATPDFKPLYASGKSLLNRGGNLPEAVGEGALKPDKLHPPFEALIFAPLALLPYRAAYLAWFCCNIAMLFSVPLLLWNDLPNLHRRFKSILVLVAFFFPALVSLLQGQDSILLLLLFTVCFMGLKTHREFSAGFALAMGMFKFVLVIPMVAGLALQRRWRAMAGFASGCLVLLFATLALVGWSGIVGYVRLIWGYSRVPPEGRGTEVYMPNLRGFLHTLAGGVVPESWLVIATVVVSIAILAWINRRTGTVALAELDLHFSMQVMVAAIVSYHLYPHDATILILPLLLTLNRFVGSGIRSPLGLSFVIAAGVMYVLPFISPVRVSMPIVFCACIVVLAVVDGATRKAVQGQDVGIFSG